MIYEMILVYKKWSPGFDGRCPPGVYISTFLKKTHRHPAPEWKCLGFKIIVSKNVFLSNNKYCKEYW
jgi:hypothetical protein